MAFSKPTFLLPSEDTFRWFELMSEEGIFLMLSLSQILIVIQKYMIGFRLLLLAFVWHGMEHIDFQGSWDFWSFPTFGVLCMYLYTINVIYLVWFQIWKKKFSPALFFGFTLKYISTISLMQGPLNKQPKWLPSCLVPQQSVLSTCF